MGHVAHNFEPRNEFLIQPRTEKERDPDPYGIYPPLYPVSRPNRARFSMPVLGAKNSGQGPITRSHYVQGGDSSRDTNC